MPLPPISDVIRRVGQWWNVASSFSPSDGETKKPPPSAAATVGTDEELVYSVTIQFSREGASAKSGRSSRSGHVEFGLWDLQSFRRTRETHRPNFWARRRQHHQTAQEPLQKSSKHDHRDYLQKSYNKCTFSKIYSRIREREREPLRTRNMQELRNLLLWTVFVSLFLTYYPSMWNRSEALSLMK